MTARGARLVPQLPDWGVILAASLIAAIPLVAPAIPPLTDLFGHLGRYAVQTGLADDPLLQRYYGFDWALLPNLGADLLVQMLAPLIGLEPAVKAIAIGTIVASVAGLLILARQAHGRIPAGAFFALPLVYGYPFQFGFLNYCLSMALALLALALWIDLGRRGLFGLRMVLFVPVSAVLLVAHVSGWGAFGLFAFAAEFARARGDGAGIGRAARDSILQCLPLALPALALLLLAGQGSEGGTGDWFNWPVKMLWLMLTLSQRIAWFDQLSVLLLAGFIAVALRSPMFVVDRALGLGALLLFGAFLLLPRILIGSAYADMRLTPFIFAIALIAIDLRQEQSHRARMVLLAAGASFFLARTVYVAHDFLRIDREIRQELGALQHIGRGERVLGLVGRACSDGWQLERRTHLPSLALVRKSAFVNDQFIMQGAQLLSIRYDKARGFDRDPAQMVLGERCPSTRYRKLGEAIAAFPRAAFDKVWVIDTPPDNGMAHAGLHPIWRYKRSVLYRIVSSEPPSATPRTAAERGPAGASPSGTAP